MIWFLLFLAALVALALLVYAMVLEPQDLRVTRVDAPIAGLHPALEGYTIAVLTDLHHTPRSRRGPLERAVRAAVDAQPDLVALLGDYGVSWKLLPHASQRLYRVGLEALGPILRPLTGARDGVVAVLGNHDYYPRAPDEVRAWLESLGARVLRDDAVTIERGAATLVVAGVPDPTEEPIGAGWCRAEHGDAPRVLLAHHPDSVLFLRAPCRVDLMLSGHTHGGQIRLPWLGAPVTHSRVCRRRTASGWVPNGRAPLYVSRGIGTIVPARFLAPPEVVVVRLVRATG